MGTTAKERDSTKKVAKKDLETQRDLKEPTMMTTGPQEMMLLTTSSRAASPRKPPPPAKSGPTLIGTTTKEGRNERSETVMVTVLFETAQTDTQASIPETK